MMWWSRHLVDEDQETDAVCHLCESQLCGGDSQGQQEDGH